MKRNIKLTIEYDGTDFQGWQIQAGSQRTVQGEITKAVHQIFQEDVKLIGAGRTDSGVHAAGQVAHFITSNTKLSTHQILQALNANLPEDVAIIKAEEVPLTFHAQYSARRKTYRYMILNRLSRGSLQRQFCHFIPNKLRLTHMRQEAKALIGRRDFRCFMAMDVSKRDRIMEKNTIRTIHSLTIKKKGDFIFIDIEANGFLYKMARNIVGTLLDVGTGKLPEGSIKAILRKKDRNLAGSTAPARGLCLMRIEY